MPTKKLSRITSKRKMAPLSIEQQNFIKQRQISSQIWYMKQKLTGSIGKTIKPSEKASITKKMAILCKERAALRGKCKPLPTAIKYYIVYNGQMYGSYATLNNARSALKATPSDKKLVEPSKDPNHVTSRVFKFT